MKMAAAPRTLVENLASNPSQIFLVDCIGALLSAGLLIAVLVPFSEEIGLPKSILYCLSMISFLLSIYSFCCWYIESNQAILLLKVLSGANCFYCILTLSLLIKFTETVTLLGIAYFAGEIAVIVTLVTLEIMIFKKMESDKARGRL